MFCSKQQMRRYLTIICIAISAMSFAQFQDNVFEQEKSTSTQQTDLNATAKTDDGTAEGNQSSFGVPGPGEQEEGPGNPGEPVPVDGYIPLLLLSGLFLMVYYQTKKRKINA